MFIIDNDILEDVLIILVLHCSLGDDDALLFVCKVFNQKSLESFLRLGIEFSYKSALIALSIKLSVLVLHHDMLFKDF